MELTVMNNLEEGFIQAMKNKKIIFGAMKRVHIYPSRVDYDDYFQEAVIIYAQTYAKKVAQDNFNVYVYQQLVWKLTDMLRREKKYYDVHSLEEFDFNRVPQNEVSDLINIFDQGLSRLELVLLQEHFIYGESLSQIAQRYGYSARNLRYWRSKLRSKLKSIVAS